MATLINYEDEGGGGGGGIGVGDGGGGDDTSSVTICGSSSSTINSHCFNTHHTPSPTNLVSSSSSSSTHEQYNNNNNNTTACNTNGSTSNTNSQTMDIKHNDTVNDVAEDVGGIDENEEQPIGCGINNSKDKNTACAIDATTTANSGLALQLYRRQEHEQQPEMQAKNLLLCRRFKDTSDSLRNFTSLPLFIYATSPSTHATSADGVGVAQVAVKAAEEAVANMKKVSAIKLEVLYNSKKETNRNM